MTAPAQIPPQPGETGDVLASIRRLISNENTSVGQVGHAADTRGSAHDGAPFRLRPDALIAAETPPVHAARAALPAVATPPPAPQAKPGAAMPPAAAPDMRDNPLPQTLAQPIAGPELSTLHGPASHGPAAGPQLFENRIFDKGIDMLASHDTTVQPLHPGAVAAADAPAAEPAPQLHAAQTPRPDLAAATDHPLRALLREAVRDELECEMRHRLDTELRLMIRAELSAALTEALARPAAA